MVEVIQDETVDKLSEIFYEFIIGNDDIHLTITKMIDEVRKDPNFKAASYEQTRDYVHKLVETMCEDMLSKVSSKGN